MVDPFTMVSLGLRVGGKIYREVAGTSQGAEQGGGSPSGSGRPAEGGSGGGGRGPDARWQEDFEKANAERRKREAEALAKWEEEVQKLMREERDPAKRREEVAKADAERAKQEREARQKWDEEMAKLQAR